MAIAHSYPVITAQEAIHFLKDGDTVAFSGFTPAGAAKAVPLALAHHAQEMHKKGEPFSVRCLTGASSGDFIDDLLADAQAVSWRAPYQSGRGLRNQINSQEVEYLDMHLSHLPQTVAFGFLGKIKLAVVEATEITRDGRIYLTTSIGASPTYLRHAEKVVVEINRRQFPRLHEMADIYVLPPPPHRYPIQVYEPLTRIGQPYAKVDPSKVVGIVENDDPDHMPDFAEPGDIGMKIAEHVVGFLLDEVKNNRLPKELFPLQAGVGNVANGVLGALGVHPDIPPFSMYSEVFQDAMVDLMEQGRLTSASACSLSVSAGRLAKIVNNFDYYADRIVLRPQEISNHPGIIRRLGVIALNTALEMDIYGNVNSSHLCGINIVNGIGGSGEFTRNSHLSLFMAPSTAKKGRISTVVPMCPHIDSNEHSVQVVVTEQGLADLRGAGPAQRARIIIDKCAHPDYRPYLNDYIDKSPMGHIRHDLSRCFELHRNLMETGRMLPDVGM